MLALLQNTGAALAQAVAPRTYRGKTTQDRRVTIQVRANERLSFKIGHRARCDNGGSVTGYSVNARRVRLDSDGSFSYTETGRATIENLGRGPYRLTMSGRVRPQRANGTYRLRQSAGGTTCRTGRLEWQARRRS